MVVAIVLVVVIIIIKVIMIMIYTDHGLRAGGICCR
jgi:hypothetical protein